ASAKTTSWSESRCPECWRTGSSTTFESATSVARAICAGSRLAPRLAPVEDPGPFRRPGSGQPVSARRSGLRTPSSLRAIVRKGVDRLRQPEDLVRQIQELPVLGVLFLDGLPLL